MIDTCTSLELFFREVLREVLRVSKLEVDQNIEYYLVRLLRQVNNSILETTLVDAYREALEKKEVSSYKYLGDISLAKASILRDYNKVDISYVESVGSRAYQTASVLARKDKAAPLFYDLGYKFPIYAKVLTYVKEEICSKDTDPLSLYESYLKTKSEIVLNKLTNLGIFVNVKESEA